MKLDELRAAAKQKAEDKVMAEADRVTEAQLHLMQRLEKLGICKSDGWDVEPVLGQPRVEVSHADLPHSVELECRGLARQWFAHLAGEEDHWQEVDGALDLLRLMEQGSAALQVKASATSWEPGSALERRAMEVVKELRAARQEWAAKAQHLALSERAMVVAKAGGEGRVILQAGGEKELGTNEAARSRALTLALGEDQLFREALDQFWEAQHEERLAKATVESLQDELKVLVAAIRIQGTCLD